MSQQVRAAQQQILERLCDIVGEGAIERFQEALTHGSYANEFQLPDNQRLEFLGDSVLGLCVSEMLSVFYPDADEGCLSRMRSALVSAEPLAAWARRWNVGAALQMGRGAEHRGERDQTNVLADAAEALVAAVFVARGLEGARKLVRDIVGIELANASRLNARDPKSTLQELVQATGQKAPVYRTLSTEGLQHEQVFEVVVLVEDAEIARGKGRTKRLAERAAAQRALDALRPGSATESQRNEGQSRP